MNERGGQLLVTIHAEEIPVKDALTKLASRIGIDIAIEEADNTSNTISLNLEKVPVYDALDQITARNGLEYHMTPELDVLVVKEQKDEAQGTGSVSGIVTDAGTGEPMPGSTVMIAGTRLGDVADSNGRFLIRNVPIGTHQLLISFMGYATEELEIVVEADERLRLEVSLEDEFVVGEDIVVTAVQRGQSRAFTQMREADNVQNVLSSEQMERFPDPTIAGALQRIPGIATVHDRGEAGEVMIRGLRADMGNVTVDGQRMPSTSTTGRSTDVRGVSIDMISAVEVNKTFTPDMHADAVSGSINLITRRPIGSERIFNVNANTGYNNSVASFMPADLNYHAGVTYGQRTPTLSYVFNASYRRDNRMQGDLRHRWDAVDFNGDGVPQDVLTRLEPSVYPIDRDRYNFSASFDYYPSDVSSYSLRATYSRRDNQNDRVRTTHRLDRGSYLEPGITTGERGRYEYNSRFDPRSTQMYTINAGGEHNLEWLNIDYRLAYSHGLSSVNDEAYRFRRDNGFDYTYDISNRQGGSVAMVGDNLTPQDLVLNQVQVRERQGTNQEISANTNIEIPYQLTGSEGSVKTGVDFRWSSKDYISRRDRWNGFHSDITLGDVELRDHYDLRNNSDWRIPWMTDRRWLNSNFFDRFGSELILDEEYSRAYGASDEFESLEVISSAYAMVTHNIGDWMFIAGLRAEYTTFSNDANEVEFDEDGNLLEIRPIGAEDNYFDIFPAFHTRYSITDRTNLRFAATQTIARPSYSELAPYRQISYDSEVVSVGNPGLVSLRSTNLDLMFEHYFYNVGVISAGFFYKSISDFTFTETTEIGDGIFEGWFQNQPVNGDDAIVYGVELGWQQRLDFLPGALSGLGIMINYTYTYSEADYGREETFPLMRQVPHILNTALSFDRGGFTGQLSYNYQSAAFWDTSTRLPSVIAEREGAFPDRYRDSFGSLDFSASQRVAPNLYAFLELVNLLDDSNMDYYLDERYPYRENWNSWRGQLGVRFRM